MFEGLEGGARIGLHYFLVFGVDVHFIVAVVLAELLVLASLGIVRVLGQLRILFVFLLGRGVLMLVGLVVDDADAAATPVYTLNSLG